MAFRYQEEHSMDAVKLYPLTDKRASILHSLYRQTGLSLADFMDKTDLSFKCIDICLGGRCESISESEIEGFAKGFDMTPAELLMYLEISDFF